MLAPYSMKAFLFTQILFEAGFILVVPAAPSRTSPGNPWKNWISSALNRILNEANQFICIFTYVHTLFLPG